MAKATKAPYFEKYFNQVIQFLDKRMMDYEIQKTANGHRVLSEGMRIDFNVRSCNVFRASVKNPEGSFEWEHVERLFDKDNDDAYVESVMKIACSEAHYAHSARAATKAPDYIRFMVRARPVPMHYRPEHHTEDDHVITVLAYVKLGILGQDPFYKFLAREEYYAADCDLLNDNSDRISTHNFRDMVFANGSPVGHSYTEGHMPEADGNFLTGGPFTFIPARARCVVESQYVLPEMPDDEWDIRVLVRTHEIKM